MKQGIVAVLVQLVKALGRQSEPLHALVIPIISSALEPGSVSEGYDRTGRLKSLICQCQGNTSISFRGCNRSLASHIITNS